MAVDVKKLGREHGEKAALGVAALILLLAVKSFISSSSADVLVKAKNTYDTKKKYIDSQTPTEKPAIIDESKPEASNPALRRPFTHSLLQRWKTAAQEPWSEDQLHSLSWLFCRPLIFHITMADEDVQGQVIDFDQKTCKASVDPKGILLKWKKPKILDEKKDVVFEKYDIFLREKGKAWPEEPAKPLEDKALDGPDVEYLFIPEHGTFKMDTVYEFAIRVWYKPESGATAITFPTDGHFSFEGGPLVLNSDPSVEFLTFNNSKIKAIINEVRVTKNDLQRLTWEFEDKTEGASIADLSSKEFEAEKLGEDWSAIKIEIVEEKVFLKSMAGWQELQRKVPYLILDKKDKKFRVRCSDVKQFGTLEKPKE